MSNRRAPGQRLINLAAKEDFVKLLDDFVAESDEYRDRSQFIRDAIVEKVRDTLGKVIPPELALPPGRAGKGGRQITSYRAEDRKQKRAANSKPAAGVTEALGVVEAVAARRRSKP